MPNDPVPTRFKDLPPEVQQLARAMVEPNEARLAFSGQDPLWWLLFEGVAVHDPFTDETGRLDVDPVQYYGAAFLHSVFCGLGLREQPRPTDHGG